MTVTALPQADQGQELLGALGAARSAVTQGLEVPLESVTDRQLEDGVTEAAALESQAQAIRLRLAAEAERRAVEADDASTGTDAWISKLTGDRREQLRGGLLLARLLQERYGQTLTALNEGRIRLEQARIIVAGLEVTADDVLAADPTLLAQAEELLIGKANGIGNKSGIPMPPVRLRREARRVYATLDTETHLAHLKASVRRSESRAKTNTWLTMTDIDADTTAGRFQIPKRHGAWLRSILEALSAPRRYGRDKTGTEVTDDAAENLGYYDVLGLALCELVEHLPKDHLPRGGTTILVHLSLADLTTALADAGCATTDGLVDISAAEARRMACEAGIVPVVLGSASVPLDLGRTTRLHTDKQRQALSMLHDSCAIAGCERPFAWCEIHHLRPWARGGGTDLGNAIPVCWHHHRAAEDPDYQLVRHSPTEWMLKRRRARRRC